MRSARQCSVEHSSSLSDWLDQVLRSEREALEFRHRSVLEEFAAITKTDRTGVEHTSIPSANEKTRGAHQQESGTVVVDAVLPETKTEAKAPADPKVEVVQQQSGQGGDGEGESPSRMTSKASKVSTPSERSATEPTEHTGRTKQLSLKHMSKKQVRNGGAVWDAILDNERVPLSWRNPKSWIQHPLFDSFFCSLIVFNTIVMAIDIQYHGLVMGHTIGYPKYMRPGHEVWPDANDAFNLVEVIFGSLFSAELIIKLVGQRIEFFSDWWNWFDSFVVACWVMDRIFSALPIDAMLLRLARLCRLLRLLRLVRTIQGFDALYILTTSLRHSLLVLLWGFLLLFLMQLFFA